MGSNSTEEGDANHHAIDIWKVNKERLASMQAKISEDPKLLSKAAGKRTCCIFRVPQSLIDANGKAYQPRIVSIGPYHRGQPRLNMMEEHKWRYLGSLLSRTEAKGLTLEDMLEAIAPLESHARECYSETIQLDTDEFIEMMVLDGCFIIELFRKVARLVPFELDDPLVTMAWILPFFYRDFLKLENQIPFFVLQRLFELSNLPEEKSKPTLSTLALEFFNNSLLRPDEVIAQKSNTKGMHLLDLIRLSFIPIDDHSYMHVAPPKMAKEEEGEKKVAMVDKLVNRILDKYEKLPAKIKDQINLEEMLANERSREVNSQGATSRGLERPVEGGPSEKLERFKIRTVAAEEVVKEDEKKDA